MTGVDWLIVLVLGLSGLVSLWRGFVREAISLLVWVSAFVISIRFSPQLAVLLEGVADAEVIRMMLAFVILFAATLVVGAIVNALMASLLKVTGLSVADRVLGVAFGVLRGGIVVLALLILLPPLLDLDQTQWWQQSLLIPQFLLLEGWAIDTFSDLSAWRGRLLGG